MEVTIKPWEGGKFDVMVASKEGAEPFLTIKLEKMYPSLR